MAAKNKTTKTLSNPNENRLAASALKQRTYARSSSVTPKSSKVIGRNVATHREALKRLADR